MPEVVLVAGRGPMAARAIRSCHRGGAKVVAVHSEVDVSAVHVRMADESVLLGPADPESSYLDLAALVEAAQVSGAQAVLPVHAILAGSAELAQLTSDAGLLWIGADPAALDAVEQSGLAAATVSDDVSPGWVTGLADGFRIDGLVVRRIRAGGAHLCWTSAEEPDALAIEGLPAAAEILATMSELIVELDWRGLVSVAFAADGAPIAVRGGVPSELGLVEARAGRDLVQAAIALAEDISPPAGSPGVPAAVGCELRAAAMPREGRQARITEFDGPEREGVLWEPGYVADQILSPWYDPVLAVVGVPGDDLSAAVDGFLKATAGISVAGIGNDLGDLRAGAQDMATRLRAGGR